MKQLSKWLLGKGLLLALLFFVAVAGMPNVWGATGESKIIKVFLAGDSTVKTYGPGKTTGGWGEYLQNYFNPQKVQVVNKAEGGRSSRSFINQGRLKEILDQIGAGDYLFIQFGHNDSATGSEYELDRSVNAGTPDAAGIYPVTPAVLVDTPQELAAYGPKYYPYQSGTFKWYLKQFVDGAKAKGAVPVLVTPVSRRYFNGAKIKPHHGPNDCYVTCVLQLAQETKVDCLDMFVKTKAMYEKVGPKASEQYQDTKANGSLDNTHYNKYGGFVVGAMVAEAIKEKGLGIAKYIVAPTETVAPPVVATPSPSVTPAVTASSTAVPANPTLAPLAEKTKTE